MIPDTDRLNYTKRTMIASIGKKNNNIYFKKKLNNNKIY